MTGLIYMLMRRLIKYPWLLLFTCSVLVTGCDFNNLIDSDVEAIVANPTLAIPLGSGNLGIIDFLGDEDADKIKIYQGGADNDVIYLVYEETLKTQVIRDLLTLPDKQITRGINLPAAVIPGGGRTTLPTQTLTFDLDFDPEKFDEILFTQGNLRVLAQTNPIIPNLQFQATLNFPSFTANGVALTQNIQSGGTPQNISIAGYKGIFNDNLFETNISVTLIAGAGATTIPPGTRFEVTLDFDNLDFDYVKGFFGEQSADLPEETLEIGAFENVFEDAEVSLADPRISFIVINEYGIPVNVNFDALEARNGTGSLGIVTNPPSPITASVPEIMGDSAFTTVLVTNAKQLLDFAPTEFYYKVSAVINEGLTNGTNFCKSDSELNVRMRVEIPFIGHASNIVMSDTLDLDLGDAENSEIESAAIKINAVNDLPLDATLQLYLLDENLMVIDSLLDPTNGKNRVVVGAETDASGTPTQPGIYDEEIEISKTKINKLFEATKILIVSHLQTSDTPKDVKFLASDKLNIKLGLKAKMNLNVDL